MEGLSHATPASFPSRPTDPAYTPASSNEAAVDKVVGALGAISRQRDSGLLTPVAAILGHSRPGPIA
jgi:hypothetical protein